MVTSSTTAYAKLTIPGRRDGSERHAEEQENEFILVLARYAHVATRDGERTRIGGEHEDPCFETTFQITRKDGTFDELILDGCRAFLEQSKKFDPSERATLVLFCPDLFEQKIICNLDDLLTDKVSWGNIHDNRYYKHWTVAFTSGNKENYGPTNKNFVTHELKTTFEFDRLVPIVVNFRLREAQEQRGDRRRRKPYYTDAQHKLNVKGENIQKVLIDLNGATTKMYLFLNAPVDIKRRVHKHGEKTFFSRHIEMSWGDGREVTACNQVLTENPVFCIEFSNSLDSEKLYSIVSRLRQRLSVPIEFARLDDYPGNTHVYKYDSPYRHCTKYNLLNGAHFLEFLEAAFPTPRARRINGYIDEKLPRLVDRNKERRFSYVYLIEVLFSRGSVVKDQLLLHEHQWIKFLEIIKEHVNDDKDHNLCESALEDLVNHVDSTSPRVGDLLTVFKRFCEERRRTQMSNQLTTEQWQEGYRKVRKVVLTPTRKIFVLPETLMNNRALAGCDHDGTRVIRVSFRDENGGPMRKNQLDELLKKILIEHLDVGFTIMGRVYGFFGSSNSQMRDGGAYFMEKYSNHELQDYKYEYRKDPPSSFKPKIEREREKLGKFHVLTSIPKAMARLGLCFTQARAFQGINLALNEYAIIPDTLGGKNASGEPYTFTDGIGMMSRGLAERIAPHIGIPSAHAPSAYQIRFRGMKGMLVVEPRLDQIVQHSAQYSAAAAPLCLFRDSQLKFDSPAGHKHEWPIELVKWSTPTGCTLNKPFINILDHVAESQSPQCHKRICMRIEELLDIQLASFARSMTDEAKCRARLEEMPRRINIVALKPSSGFTLSTEPFFRSLIKAAIDVAMAKLLAKVQVQVPPSCGRTMFGVTDETGQLQYGQVFIKRSLNVNSRSTNRVAQPYVGKVLIAKFPAVVGGDVRMFEAVDIPELHHLDDVVVFPQTGPRPHPDEMAGSDLDGDEYAIIWDPLLFFEHNEPAFEYSNDKPKKEYDPREMDKMMHEFYAEYLENESVGHISVNHLYQSDQYGLDSDVCNQLAKKNSMALDFSKSGVAPEKLTREWAKDICTGQWIQPEQSERMPDFALGTNKCPTSPIYVSSRLLGTIYRELRTISDVVATSTTKPIEVVADPLLTYSGWERYADEAEKQLKSYNCRLRAILDQYGIGEEAEAFSGYFRTIRNRISDRDSDDMSMFNTEKVIATLITDLFRSFRVQFFAEFGEHSDAYMQCTETMNSRDDPDQKDVLKRVCRAPSPDIMRKAVAYYRVCYDNAATSKDRKLSFAWIAHDVLNAVKMENITDLPRTQYPQLQVINDHRNSFINDNQEALDGFKSKISTKSSGMEEEARKIVSAYVQRYPGLEKCLFVVDSWARAKQLLGCESDVSDGMSEKKKRDVFKIAAESKLQWYHVSLLVVMFATKEFGSIAEGVPGRSPEEAPILERITSPCFNNEPDAVPESDLDALTLAFFHFLASRRFRKLRHLNFRSIGLMSVFMRGQWLGYHKAGVKTYYNLTMNMRFDELPISSESVLLKTTPIREGVPFFIELPNRPAPNADVNAPNDYIQSILEYLRAKTRCAQIEARVTSRNRESDPLVRILISSRGTCEALNELRDLCTISIPRNVWTLQKSTSSEIALLTYYKIVGVKFRLSKSQ